MIFLCCRLVRFIHSKHSLQTDNLIKILNELNFVHETTIKYKTDDAKKEFFVKLSDHLKDTQPNRVDYISRCKEFLAVCKEKRLTKKIPLAQQALMKLSDIKGGYIYVFLNVTFLRINVDGSNEK